MTKGSNLAALGALVIVAAAVAVYWPSLSGTFLMDDDRSLMNNPIVASPDGLYRCWLPGEASDYDPITNTTLWLEWRLWKANSTGYRVTNLLLHIATSLLVWLTLRKLSVPGPFLAALLYDVHPVNVEAVAWISQRTALLAALFFLLSVLWYLRAEDVRAASKADLRQPGALSSLGRWYWLSLFAFAAAMLSNSSVATLPLVLLIIVGWLHRRIARHDVARMLPFFGVAVVVTSTQFWFQTGPHSDASVAARLAGAGAVVWFYLSKALVPINLALVYPQWDILADTLRWWLPSLAAIAVSVLLWRQRRRTWIGPLLFAWAVFCLTLAPVMGFAETGFMVQSFVADRYSHIALVGIVAATAAAWSAWHTAARGAVRAAAVAIATAAVGTLAFVAWNQNRLFSDPLTLYLASLEKNPNSWKLHNELGSVLSNIGRVSEAIEQFREALRLKADYSEAHNNWGIALYNQDKIPDAMYHFQEAIYLNPGFADAYFNRGNALFKANRWDEAIEQYAKALQLNPHFLAARVNLGIALATMGQLQPAVEQLEQALQLDPDNLKVYSNLTTAYAQMQQPARAIAAAQKALSLAQSEGQTELAQSIEAWLTKYRAQPANQPR